MAIKQQTQTQTEIAMKPLKRLRHQEEADQPNATMADRLSTLPEDLQLRILSSLETQHAFQTSLLSKTWSSKWTHVPVLNFNSLSFNKFSVFDKFVFGVLSVPRSAQLVKINFRRLGACSDKILKKVFDYAFKQRVEELNVCIKQTRKDKSTWPMIVSQKTHTSWDSLKSLKLESYVTDIGCPFLGPTSGSFKNLASLHLRKAIIADVNPFSRFPALKKLKLVFCKLQTDDYAFNVHNSHLSELIIYYHHECVNRCNLTTPNLKYFLFRGGNFPQIEVTGGPRVIDTVIIEYTGRCQKLEEKKLFDDLMMFLKVLCNVKSLTVYSSVVHILSLFPDELENWCSPFRDLKSLKVDLSLFYEQKLFEGKCRSLSEALRHVSRVKDYLLQKSPDAKCTVIYPDAPGLSSHPQCLDTRKCNCGSFNTICHLG